MFTILFLSCAAFLAGFIDSIAGGGGLITLPALLAAGVPAHFALGTNKFQSMFGTTSALVNFHRKSKVVWKCAAAGIPTSLIGSVIGAKLALIIPQLLLAKIMIFTLPPILLFVLTAKQFLKAHRDVLEQSHHQLIITSAICLIIGLYDGFFGPGTGTFLIVALVIFARMPFVHASATAKTFNLASNVGAFATFIVSGHVLYTAGIIMALANIGGNLLGSSLAIKHGGRFVSRIVVLSLSLLFVYLVWKYYF